ncbi:DNA topoisomerase III [Bacillus thuringiensis serovar pakistani str. T13001]|nr:DNA topoisomerase III [Bacillus thuringiensis serovar pakistani str. T13001]
MTYNQTELFTEVNQEVFKSTGKQITHLGWNAKISFFVVSLATIR